MRRQREREHRALARHATGEQRAAMAFDYALGRRQADALARELRIVVQALERAEQLVRVRWIEAHAVVADVERKAVGLHAELDAPVGFLARELPCIAEQVLQEA